MIRIYTNYVPTLWEPEDLFSGLGGSEEAVILLASELAKYNDVVVYHPSRNGGVKEFFGVTYAPRSEFVCSTEDTLITFKDHTPHAKHKCKVNIHWSCEVERPWDTDTIDWFVNVSPYHSSRNIWVDGNKEVTIPFGIDMGSLGASRTTRKEETALYASSPDRGLIFLLNDWKKLRIMHPGLRLKIAYGFETFDAISKGNANAEGYKQGLLELMKQDGIEYLGHQDKGQIERLYWESEYWALPLDNPDSELFCLNAVKAQYCGAKPVVNKIGALRNTVGAHISYLDFLGGSTELKGDGPQIPATSWKDVAIQWKAIL